MEEKEHSGTIDNPETMSPSADSPTADVYDEVGPASRNFLESEERRPALSRRLATAFREGVASTRPDYDERREVRIPPPVRTERQRSDDARTLDKMIQEGGTIATALYDKAAGALDSAVRLAKTAPAASTKWAEAFREGFTSAGRGEAKAKTGRIPHPPDRQQSGDKGIMDRILQIGGSAAEIVRDAVASVQPGEVREAEKKIRMGEKKVKDLYVEIGHEAVDSWSTGGSVETEKLDGLFDELRRNEEEIRDLKERIAETFAARKAGADRPQRAAKEVVSTPKGDGEDIGFVVGVSGVNLDQQVLDLGDRQQPESPESGDLAATETSVSTAPEAWSPASSLEPEQVVDAEAAPQEEQGVVAEVSEPPMDQLPGETSAQAPEDAEASTEPAQQEEAGVETDQVLSEKPAASRKKKTSSNKR